MKLNKKHSLQIIATVFVLYLCMSYWKPAMALGLKLLRAASPIFLGLAIAYVLNILMSSYERLFFAKKKAMACKTQRVISLMTAFLTLCAIIALIVWLVIPELLSCLKLMLAVIPPAIDRLLSSEWTLKILPEGVLNTLSNVNWQEYLAKAAQWVTSGIGNAAGTIFTAVTSIFSWMLTLFLGIVFSIYFLFSKEILLMQCKRFTGHYLPEKLNQKLLYVANVLNESFRKYIVGQCTEAVILGCLCILGMLLFRFPYAVMIGTFVGFTALIPVAGAYIGALIGAFMIFTLSPLKALFFLIFIIILQQLEGNLVYPKVVGKTTGLPAFLVLAAITLGGSLLGIAGMLIGVPVISAIYRLFAEDMQKRETAQDTPQPESTNSSQS